MMDVFSVRRPRPETVFVKKEEVSMKSQGKPSPLVSLLAGGIAGGVEGFATYPFEFAKTATQLRNQYSSNNPLRIIASVVRNDGLAALYTGCSSLVVGCFAKAGVRFLTYDSIKSQLSSSSGKHSLASGFVAGIGAGVAESLFAVTPTERIKTALIDDAKIERRFRSGFHAVQVLAKEQGLVGLYRGCGATTMKQAATSAVRMGSYNVLKEASKSAGVETTAASTFAMGAVAGAITVFATQPFDTVKTRAQSVAGAGPVEAFRSVLSDSGVRGLWKGSTMRMGRLLFSGGIIFSIYEKFSVLLTKQGL